VFFIFAQDVSLFLFLRSVSVIIKSIKDVLIYLLIAVCLR